VAGSFTTYGRKLLIDGLFITPAPIGTVYVALCFVVPGTTDDATRLIEPIGLNYSRKSYAGGWLAGTAGEAFNANQVTFAVPSAEWGVLRGWAICNAATAGKVIASGALRSPTPVKAGTQPVIATRGIRVALR
jgi:hypothetical protein